MGIKAILPHVDDFRTVHNLTSLADLADVLGKEQIRKEESLSSFQRSVA